MILVRRFCEFYKKLGLKTSLHELEIDETYFVDMANRATINNTKPIGHYYPLDAAKIVEVLKMSL